MDLAARDLADVEQAATLVGAAGTIYLYVTRPEVTKRAATVSPWVSTDGAGVAISAPLF